MEVFSERWRYCFDHQLLLQDALGGLGGGLAPPRTWRTNHAKIIMRHCFMIGEVRRTFEGWLPKQVFDSRPDSGTYNAIYYHPITDVGRTR